MRLLLDAGADPNAQVPANLSWTPLHYLAAKNGSELEVATLLYDYGADISARDRNGRNPSFFARDRGNTVLANHLDTLLRSQPPRRAASPWNHLDRLLGKTTEEIVSLYRAEEDRKERIRSERKTAGKCIQCGQPLGFFKRISGTIQHSECTAFKE